VTFHGFRPNSFDYIAHADALLMPSLYEGLPYTALEAMSLGTPLIASRVGGLAEILKDGQTALLVEPRNTSQLAAAVAKLARDEPLAGRLRAAAADDVAARFSASAMARQYLEAFEDALAAQRAERPRASTAG
jgi:glycosyltransferase involved in cell wall biosynthesis